MKITISSTDQIIELERRDGRHGISVPARLWEGFTESGVPVHVYVTRLSPQIEDTPENQATLAEFSKELLQHQPPSVEFGPIPLRLIL